MSDEVTLLRQRLHVAERLLQRYGWLPFGTHAIVRDVAMNRGIEPRYKDLEFWTDEFSDAIEPAYERVARA